MESPKNVSVLVVAQPYLLATALADMLIVDGFAVCATENAGPVRVGDHVCVALLGPTAQTVGSAGAIVRLPVAFAEDAVTVDVKGRRFKIRVGRPRELASLIAALAIEAGCCTQVSLAAG